MTRLCCFVLWLVPLFTCHLRREEPPARVSNRPELHAAFRRNGLISSSTYQVSLSLEAATREEARRQGGVQAKDMAFYLIMQEPFIRKYLSRKARDEVRNLVESTGRVVRVFPEGGGTWRVVLQVSKIGLRNYLERLR